MMTKMIFYGIASYLLIVVAANDFCQALGGIMTPNGDGCCPKACGKCGGPGCGARKGCCISDLSDWDVCEHGRKAPCKLAGAQIDDGMRTDYAFLMAEAYNKENKVGDRLEHGVTKSKWRVSAKLLEQEGLMWLLKGINRYECVVNTMGSDNLCLPGKDCSDLDNNFDQWQAVELDNTGIKVARGYQSHARAILREPREEQANVDFDQRGWQLLDNISGCHTGGAFETMRPLSLGECSKQCFWNPDCKGFSLQTREGVCFLYNENPEPKGLTESMRTFFNASLSPAGLCYEKETSAPKGCSMGEDEEHSYCDWHGEDKAGRKSLGGGGHNEYTCKRACQRNADCNYAAFMSENGGCHMFKTCNNPSDKSSWKMFKKECSKPKAEFRSQFWIRDPAYCEGGKENRNMQNRDECSELCLYTSKCTGFSFVDGTCRIFTERPAEQSEESSDAALECYTNEMCEWNKSNVGVFCGDETGWSYLNGDGHTLQECKDACVARGDQCNFVSYFKDGSCHLFKTCNDPRQNKTWKNKLFQKELYEKKCSSTRDDHKTWKPRVSKTNQDVLKDFLEECKREKRDIGLTGHSLGGSVATWLAIALDKGAYGLPKIPVTRVITYGAIRLVMENDSKRCPARLQKRNVAERIIARDNNTGEIDPAPRGFVMHWNVNNKFCFEAKTLDQLARYENQSAGYPLNKLTQGNLVGGVVNWANYGWYMHLEAWYLKHTVQNFKGHIGGIPYGIPCVPPEPLTGIEVPGGASCSNCKEDAYWWPQGPACGRPWGFWPLKV